MDYLETWKVTFSVVWMSNVRYFKNRLGRGKSLQVAINYKLIGLSSFKTNTADLRQCYSKTVQTAGSNLAGMTTAAIFIILGTYF